MTGNIIWLDFNDAPSQRATNWPRHRALRAGLLTGSKPCSATATGSSGRRLRRKAGGIDGQAARVWWST